MRIRFMGTKLHDSTSSVNKLSVNALNGKVNDSSFTLKECGYL